MISITDKTLKYKDFILYDYFQSGIYKYDLFLNKIEKGKVYLKIFEITKNQKLSERSIKEESQIEVENKTDEIKRFELKDEFTIFEGDWGQFYGGRIEVWFKPDNINKPERNGLQKHRNYNHHIDNAHVHAVPFFWNFVHH